MTAAPRRTDAVVVLVTGPEKILVEMGRTLVFERQIACLNVVHRATSIYRWKGKIHEDDEALGVLKTTVLRVPELKRRIEELHPYDVPEVLVLPVNSGSEAYLDWIRGEVRE